MGNYGEAFNQEFTGGGEDPFERKPVLFDAAKRRKNDLRILKVFVAQKKWSEAGSNRRHRPFQGRALPTELSDLFDKTPKEAGQKRMLIISLGVTQGYD